MKLIIQIPCYNEEKTLPQTFADLPKQIDGVDKIEYLIINDGSSDRTAEVARELGIDYVVGFRQNRGLARGFMAGIDACLKMGADVIVNTDADNQYCGADITKLVAPIIAGEADIVIGERPIDEIEHFSAQKKRFQRFGSFVVRVASGTDVPDAPSGFRAYSREAALRLNVINEYTYTLETIIQAGYNRSAIKSVPIRTNPETRKSRLFGSMYSYMKRSASVIIRSFMMYRPLKFFGSIGAVFFTLGTVFAIRFFFFFFQGHGESYSKSFIAACVLIMLSVLTIIFGLLSDIVAANRKLLEDIQYRIRKIEYTTENMESDSKATKTSVRM